MVGNAILMKTSCAISHKKSLATADAREYEIVDWFCILYKEMIIYVLNKV